MNISLYGHNPNEHLLFLLFAFGIFPHPLLFYFSEKSLKKLTIKKSIFSFLLSFCDIVLREERALKNKNRQCNNSNAQTKLEIKKNILFFQQRLFHLTSNTILKQRLRHFLWRNFLSNRRRPTLIKMQITWPEFYRIPERQLSFVDSLTCQPGSPESTIHFDQSLLPANNKKVI